MKNTRKKMLLSSVAMLLVALVALGSATYAWFSINKSVTANVMQVTASAPKGLQITGKNGDEAADATDSNWGAKVDFTLGNTQVGAVSVPYTTTLGTTAFYPETVKDASSSAVAVYDGSNGTNFENWDDVTIATDIGTVPAAEGALAQKNGNYFVAYEVGIRATDDATAAQTVTCTYTLTSATGIDNKYLRAAIIDSAADSTYTGGTLKAVVADGAEAVKAIATDGPTLTASTLTTNASGGTFTFNLPQVSGEYKANKAKWFTVVLWVEGQDSDCYDAYPSLTGDLKLDFTVA